MFNCRFNESTMYKQLLNTIVVRNTLFGKNYWTIFNRYLYIIIPAFPDCIIYIIYLYQSVIKIARSARGEHYSNNSPIQIICHTGGAYIISRTLGLYQRSTTTFKWRHRESFAAKTCLARQLFATRHMDEEGDWQSAVCFIGWVCLTTLRLCVLLLAWGSVCVCV